ncbi:MAG: Lrp/AsnC ligand binding domain-containing protein [Candidatus Bathyarchaeota archaeon]|nr:MAG: Lrp/AsnC ligand binding domain-containing protein [Candidatus Bathyarchaeota archaeon]
MKNIKPKLIDLFKGGYCTPQIARIASTLKEPSSTIHYNIKKLENEGAIKAYKAVFDYEKINEGFCVYVLVNISPEYYNTPIAEELSKLEEVESAATIAGEWDIILKIRTKNQNEYYDILKKHLLPKGVTKTLTLTTLKDIKTNYVFL